MGENIHIQFHKRVNKELTSRMFFILKTLKHYNVPEKRLIEEVWGSESYFIKRSLYVYITKLKRMGFVIEIENGIYRWVNKEKPI